jgi:hypothetical protein
MIAILMFFLISFMMIALMMTFIVVISFVFVGLLVDLLDEWESDRE